MLLHLGKNPAPVQTALAGVDDMSDVGSVEAFPTQDEKLRHQQLLGSQNPNPHVQNHGGARIFNPRLLHRDYGVAHAGDQVHKKSMTAGLVQPHRILGPAAETIFLQTTNRCGYIFWCEKQVYVLGRAPDSGMDLKGECA